MIKFIHKKVSGSKRRLAHWLLRKSIELDTTALLRIEAIPGKKGMYGEPFTFLEDGLATIHASDFTEEPEFKTAYSLGAATGSWKGWDLRWRVNVILWCASWASRLPGDFVECGVNRGGFTRAILEYTQFQRLNKKYYLFDTFAGFDDKFLSTAESAQVASKYDYEDCYESVKTMFGNSPFISIIRGTVPETLTTATIDNIAFLSIDMNCTAPEIAAAEFFWPKMAPGAVLILDDYGFSLHSAQKKAFNEFAKKMKVEILRLPTGQGLMFKP